MTSIRYCYMFEMQPERIVEQGMNEEWDMQVLNEDIKQGKYKNYYLLTGNDEFLINSFKKKLFRLISMDNPMNQSKFEGDQADADAFIDIANTLPFLSEARCVLVEDSNWFKLGKGESADEGEGSGKNAQTRRLIDAIDAFPDSTYVIFAERNVDKRSALYKKIAKRGYAATLNHPTREQLKDWVLRKLQQDSRKITSGNMNLFLDYVGDDMERVGNELEKLLSYTLDKEVIEQEDIENMTSVNVENRIFDMVEDIALGRADGAIRKYTDLTDLKVSPFLVMNLIARQFNQIMLVKSMLERNLAAEDMARRLGLKPFVVGKLINLGRSYTIPGLKEILNRILDLEMQCKRGEMDVDMACILLMTSSRAAREAKM